MITLSESLKTYKLNSLRGEREGTEAKTKNDYLSTLLKQQNDRLRNLEEENADFESKINKQREEFRQQDNDRVRKFF